MYKELDWWFPDEDTHFVAMLNKSVAKGQGNHYQKHVRDASLNYVNNFNVALDIGANVGLWSKDLCEKFDRVIAFEPVEKFRECLVKNVPNQNLLIQPFALGEQETTIEMIVTPENTGHSHVDQNSFGIGSIAMYKLDTLDFDRIDYCKIDCEGYELPILKGGEQTFKKHRPIMVVEQKLHKDVGITERSQYDAVDLLKSWGARELTRVRNDVVLGW